MRASLSEVSFVVGQPSRLSQGKWVGRSKNQACIAELPKKLVSEAFSEPVPLLGFSSECVPCSGHFIKFTRLGFHRSAGQYGCFNATRAAGLRCQLGLHSALCLLLNL